MNLDEEEQAGLSIPIPEEGGAMVTNQGSRGRSPPGGRVELEIEAANPGNGFEAAGRGFGARQRAGGRGAGDHGAGGRGAGSRGGRVGGHACLFSEMAGCSHEVCSSSNNSDAQKDLEIYVDYGDPVMVEGVNPVMVEGVSGPSLRFNSPDWVGADQEASYARAVPHFISWKEELLSQHGYTDGPGENAPPLPPEKAIFTISKSSRVLQLPSTASEFIGGSQWCCMFERISVVTGAELFKVDEPVPLVNIISLLQTVFFCSFDNYELLVITDDENRTFQRVPTTEWLTENEERVKQVLETESTDKLKELSESYIQICESYYPRETDCHSDDGYRDRNDDDYGDSDYYGNFSEPETGDDFAACDKDDCGYCGKCFY